MPQLAGIHHVATLTADLDRLIAFYERVFDARVLADMEEEGLRHAFIELGPATMLHPFQIPGADVPQGAQAIFERGRIDHFALNARDEDTFWALAERIAEAGAGDGVVTDLGAVLSVNYTDPDGVWGEVTLAKPGVPLEDSRRENWKTVERPAAP